MADPKLREILEPMNELMGMTPPHDAAQRSLTRIRGSLIPKERFFARPMTWIIGAGFAAVAAAMAIAIRPSAPIVPKVEPSAAQLLQRAVTASNNFRGMIQVEWSDVALDDKGHPAALPVVANATILTDRPVPQVVQMSSESQSNPPRGGRQVMPVQANSMQSGGFIARGNPIAPQGPVTMLIPLTWEGVHIVPIPLTWEGVQIRPLAIQSPATVTRVSTQNSDEFRISERLPITSNNLPPATLEIGRVNVNPSTGLIQNVEMNAYQQGLLHRQQILYRYQDSSSLTTQPSSGR